MEALINTCYYNIHESALLMKTKMRVYWNGSSSVLSGEVEETQETEENTYYLVRMDNGKQMLVNLKNVIKEE